MHDGERSRLRVAIAGAGFASGPHLAAWARLADAEVVAICDPDRPKAQSRAAEFRIARVFDDAAAMLDAARPAALDIAAPLATHVPLCELAAARGVHILCQKPLAPTLADAERLAAHVAGRVRLMVHENWRFRPHYRRIRRWLDERLIGDPVSCMMQVRASGLIADERGRVPQLERQPGFGAISRLMIGEVLIHHLDVLRWLLGPLVVVAARTKRLSRTVDGEDVALVLLEGSGFWVALEGNFSVPGAPPVPIDRVEITGTEGVLTLDGDTVRVAGRHSRAETFDLAAGYADSYAAAIAHFASALASGAPFETDVRDNLETLALVEQSYAKALPLGR
jgi:predicted dehydrogenase